MEEIKNQPLRFLTTQELADRLRCSAGHLSNERSRGRGIPYIKIGSAVVYDATDVEIWVTARKVHTSAA